MKHLLVIFTLLLASRFVGAKEIMGADKRAYDIDRTKNVVLKGDDGGRLDKRAFATNEIKNSGKVYFFFYVDPDKSELNNEAADKLEAEKFDKSLVRSTVVANMDATWLPNFLLKAVLKVKQHLHPTTEFIMDYNKVLVKEWKLADDEFNFILYDQKGLVLHRSQGLISPEETQKIIETVYKHTGGKSSHKRAVASK